MTREEDVSYLNAISKKIINNGDYSLIETEMLRLKRIFVVWQSTIEFFKFARPIIYVDGTFLKGQLKIWVF